MFSPVLISVIAFILGGLLIGSLVGFYMYSKLSIQVSEWKTKFETLTSLTEDKKIEVNLIQNQLSLQFQNLAQKIFEEKSTRFSDQNHKQLSVLLDPLKERIKDFEKKVDDVYSQERFERGHLKGEISKLIELNQSMSQEAHNLVTALKGENKTQGNWGELILENILERSGLRKNEEYFTQETVKNNEGQMLRPDVVVKLPDGKHLIVDSKMTLTAYEAYCSAEDTVHKEKMGLQHVESLKRHIQELSEKKYHLAETLISPDFVMLFMALEPAFALAFQLKPDLFEYAWSKNIAIVSPTTLLTSLRTVAALWKQDRQQKNALDIAKKGGELYDKFVLIVNDLEQMGKKIKSLTESHEQLTNRISTGRGNLISQVEKLKELGAKTEKSLPQIAE